MKKRSKIYKAAHLACLLILFAAGCGAPPTTQPPPANTQVPATTQALPTTTQPPATNTQAPTTTQAPTATTETPTSACQEVELSVWFPNEPLDENYVQGLFDVFEKQSCIKVTAKYYNFQDLFANLIKSGADNALPDATLLTYNYAGQLFTKGYLETVNLPQWNFFPDAVNSNRFDNDNNYGVPWLRRGCAPNYYSLYALRKDNPSSNAVDSLFAFLTSKGIQTQIYDDRSVDPTLSDITTDPQCKDVTTLRVPPDQIAPMVSRVITQSETLKDNYPVELDVVNATGYITTGQETPALRAVAVTQVYTPTMASVDIQATPTIFVGAVFTDLNFNIGQDPVIGKLSPGNYIVECPHNPASGQPCTFSTPGAITPIQATPETAESSADGGTPSTAIVQGSVKVCWWVDSVHYCVTFF